MKKFIHFRRMLLIAAFFTPMMFVATSCEDLPNDKDDEIIIDDPAVVNAATVFLLIDEESIDNGNEPNNFSETDVNDQISKIGQRTPLKYFNENIGKSITLYTGEVGNEGWHALKTIPASWKNAGPNNNGLANFLVPGPGLGGGADDREVLLDKIPDVTPLRATGLAMLKGMTILAVVYDSDISINYSPLLGNLQGNNLGIVALKVLDVQRRTDGSSSSLPKVLVEIQDVNVVKTKNLYLFKNAPVPRSSSEPEDIMPPTNYPKVELVAAP